MVPVVMNTERLFDNLRNPGRGPQFGTITVGYCTFEEELDKTLSLACFELWRTTRYGLCVEALIPMLVA